jgi:type IV secretory pathway VirB9-like protein
MNASPSNRSSRKILGVLIKPLEKQPSGTLGSTTNDLFEVFLTSHALKVPAKPLKQMFVLAHAESASLGIGF